MNQKPTLYLIRGTPGSGKTTLAKQFVESGIAHANFEADDYFTDSKGQYKFDHSKLGIAHSQCLERTKNCLESGMNVVVSNTFTRDKEVAPYQQLAWKMGIKMVSIIVENRANSKSIHNVPEANLENMRKRFQVKV